MKKQILSGVLVLVGLCVAGDVLAHAGGSGYGGKSVHTGDDLIAKHDDKKADLDALAQQAQDAKDWVNPDTGREVIVG